MAKTRKSIPSLVQKRVFQEAGSKCASCQEAEVASLEIHHIDSDPNNNKAENLIVVCRNCHARISRGIISEADVVTKKRELYWTSKQKLMKQTPAVNVQISDSSFVGNIAQNITNISTKRSVRVTHPLGSIGANVSMKSYIDYLITKYYDFRKADRSYGRKTNFSYAVIHKNIQRNFGAKTFFLPEDSFRGLVKYLCERIDQTIQGKRNRKKGISNYHSFEDHQEKYSL